jgi:CheY-like chemotaxis protein
MLEPPVPTRSANRRAQPVSRILAVEDEPDLRFLLRRFLERVGHEVTEAGDGATALALALQSLPDLVITDMVMPVMTGAELIRCLRATPATAAVPILAVTGSPELAVGADVVLAKPYEWLELIAAAEALIKEGRDA